VEFAAHELAFDGAAGIVADVGLPGGQFVGDDRVDGRVGAVVFDGERIRRFAVDLDRGRR
jgi:hypothetical protein